jgi:hypothetical protein
MADESGTVRLSKAWLTPQILITLAGILATGYASFVASDYRIAQLEKTMNHVIEKLDQRADTAEAERVEWARTSARFEADLKHMTTLNQQMRNDLETVAARLSVLERSK